MGAFHESGGSPGWLFRFIKGPGFSASVFFLLSGFLLASRFQDRPKEFSLKQFLKKRLWDLYPLHFITTLLMLPLVFDSGKSMIIFIGSLFQQLSLGFSLWPVSEYTFNTPSWALSAMFIAYLFFPVFLRSLSLKPLVFWSLQGLSFSFLVVWAFLYDSLMTNYNVHDFFQFFFLPRVAEFYLGIGLYRVYLFLAAKKRFQVRKVQLFLFPVFLLAVFCGLYFINNGEWRGERMMRWMTTHVFSLPLFATLVLVLALDKQRCLWLWHRPLLRKAGQASFYPYLLHIPWFCWLSVGGKHLFERDLLFSSTGTVILATFILYLFSAFYFQSLGKLRRNWSVKRRVAQEELILKSGIKPTI